MQHSYVLLIILVILCCLYYLYLQNYNSQRCATALTQYKTLNIKLSSGSILLFANRDVYDGQQLFYSYTGSCFTHVDRDGTKAVCP